MAPGGLLQETHNPDWKPTPQQTIPRGQAPGLARSAVGRDLGRLGRRRGVRPHRAVQRRQAAHRRHPEEDRHRVAAAAGRAAAKGDLLVCDIYTKRVAGEFDDAPKEAETERERPMRIWLARMDDTQFRYPVKLEASTCFATIRGRLLSFRERPLTPAEAEAIRR